MPIKFRHFCNQFFYVVATADRTVQSVDICIRYCIKFQYIIIDFLQCFEHRLTQYLGCVAQHAYFGFGEVFVAQSNHIVHNLRKVWMHRRLSITCEGQHIRLWTFLLHLLQLLAQSIADLLSAWHTVVSHKVVVEPTFAIDAVERAALPVVRQEIDAQ